MSWAILIEGFYYVVFYLASFNFEVINVVWYITRWYRQVSHTKVMVLIFILSGLQCGNYSFGSVSVNQLGLQNVL